MENAKDDHPIQPAHQTSLKELSSVKKMSSGLACDKLSHNNISTCQSIEFPRMGQSNYKSFLAQWEKNKAYPLPSPFKLIQITNKTDSAVGGDYEWFNFPILSYSCKQLCQIAVKIIDENGFNNFVSSKLTSQLVQEVCAKYKSVSYHNFSHGFSLMHMLYQLTKLDKQFRQMYTTEEIGYCLIAALSHDMGHPGTNNSYEVKTKTKLAAIANNEAVLQKMHIQQFFALIKQKKLDIFAKSSNPIKMKQLMVQVILATDISAHFKNLQRLKQMLPSKTDSITDQNRYFYMEQAFHACDIGNPCLQFQEYINWASLLSYQFNTQTIMESENNVEVTGMLRFKNMKGFYQGQVGFINFLVFPLWKELAYAWPGFSLLIGNIQTNLKLLEIKAENDKND